MRSMQEGSPTGPSPCSTSVLSQEQHCISCWQHAHREDARRSGSAACNLHSMTMLWVLYAGQVADASEAYQFSLSGFAPRPSGSHP